MKLFLQKISTYFSLVKFSHTIFAMPFALIGFFIAINQPSSKMTWHLLIFTLMCMVFARNAAMGFNRYLDRHYDAKNSRTQMREIPAGIVGPKSALWFVLLNAALFIITTYFMNILVLILSPVALAVILGYSYTKRFTPLCHFVLGIGLALAPIGAYLAVTSKFAILPLVFSFIVLFWVSGFDIIYALQDEEFDKSLNLKSIPVFLGKKNALILSTVLHVISGILVVVAGIFGKTIFGLLFWPGSIIFISLLIYQHLLVKPNDLSRVNMAFATTNGFASVIFATFTILSIYI
jgi:4-hydroxybenzoate polyprenyltransferase